jgi:hypothetical protein
MSVSPMKQPSALLPIVMSIAALVLARGNRGSSLAASHGWTVTSSSVLRAEMASAGSRTGGGRASDTRRRGPRRMRPRPLVQAVGPGPVIHYYRNSSPRAVTYLTTGALAK